MCFQSPQEAFYVYQTQEMSFLSGKATIPRLCSLIVRYLHREWVDCGHMWFVWTLVNRRYTNIPTICHLLLSIYSRLQPDSCVSNLYLADYNSLATSNLVFTGESSTKAVYNGNVIGNDNIDDEANVVNKTHTESSISETSFLTSEARLVFVKLR